jgi:hypothetical protein
LRVEFQLVVKTHAAHFNRQAAGKQS